MGQVQTSLPSIKPINRYRLVISALDALLHVFRTYLRVPLHRASSSFALAEASRRFFAAISAWLC